jgi:hypothetical protein
MYPLLEGYRMTKLIYMGCLLITLFFVPKSYSGDTWETSVDRWTFATNPTYGTTRDTDNYYDGPSRDETTGVVYSGSQHTGVASVIKGTVISMYCNDAGVAVRVYPATSNNTWWSNIEQFEQWESNATRTCNPVLCENGGVRGDDGQCPDTGSCDDGEVLIDDECVPYCNHAAYSQPVGFYGVDTNCVEPPCGNCESLNSTNNTCYMTDIPEGFVYYPSSGDCNLDPCGDNQRWDVTQEECVDDCPYGTHLFAGECVQDCGPGKVTDAETGACIDDPELEDQEAVEYGDPVEIQPMNTPDEVEPEGDAPDNDSDPSNEKLSAIEKNLQKMITQGNYVSRDLANMQDQLQWIGKNEEKSVDNLYSIGKAIQNMNNNLASNIASGIKSGLGSVNQGLNSIQKGIDSLEGTIAGTAYKGEAVDVPTYDATIDETQYEQYEDMSEFRSGQLQATKDFTDQALEDMEQPFDAELTASGDPCINGTIHGKEINVCFNPPWAVQAYPYMKAVLYFLGYLQSALLINKAIGGR